LIPNELRDISVEKEIEYDENYSRIGAIVKISSENFSQLMELNSGNDSCFFISSRSCLFFMEANIEVVIKNCLLEGDWTELNYAKLFNHFCLDGSYLMRFGGDEDTYNSLQIFHLKKDSDILMEMINAALIANNGMPPIVGW
jgi:hypothetical protein